MSTRRWFLKETARGSLAIWAAAGRAHLARAAEPAEALTLKTLTRMARLIYPHDGLSDLVYAGIVGELLIDPKQGALLQTGADDLGGFLQLTEPQQLVMLRGIEHGEFFQAVRTPLMWVLYNAQELWELIDYPGPSLPFGGYINRGFDDIDWLPST